MGGPADKQRVEGGRYVYVLPRTKALLHDRLSRFSWPAVWVCPLKDHAKYGYYLGM